jgi:hypothetical protein
MHKSLSRVLSKKDAENLSSWEEAIAEAKRHIAECKKSLKTLEALRDSGMAFPKPKKRRSRKAKRAEPVSQ